MNKLFRKSVALSLALCMLISLLSGCASSQNPRPDIDTEAIADVVSSDIQAESSSAEEVELKSESEFSAESFVYRQIFNEYSLVYDTFNAVMYLNDGTEICGIGYTDYADYYAVDGNEKGYFPAGFIADFKGIIPFDESEEGLIIENLDCSDERYLYVYAYDTEPFTEHCVVKGQYLKYGVNEQGSLTYESSSYQRGVCDEELGALYSYDDSRFLFDPDMGNYVPISGLSLFDTIDYAELEAEVNRILEQQNINFSQQDINTAAYTAQEAVVSYFLSMQEESFLGFDVAELAASAEKLDPTECIRISPEGSIIITVDDELPQEADALAKWSVGIGCGIFIIGSVALDIFCPAALPLTGALSGAAIDVFMQVVADSSNPADINWKKVAVASVSGALLAWACPLAAGHSAAFATKFFENEFLGKLAGYGVLTLSNGLVSGVTSYATSKADGEDAGWDTFLMGASIGAAFTVLGSATAEASAKAAPHISKLLSHTKAGRWLINAGNNAGTFIKNHRITISEKLDDILVPKSVHESASQAMLEVNRQIGAKGGCYTMLRTDGYERHEMPSFSAVKKVTGVETRDQAKIPAIRITPKDHRMTASYGRSNQATEYCDKQAALIAKGDYQGAIQMDIDDITSKFGTKYDDAISEMLEYAKKIGWWQ